MADDKSMFHIVIRCCETCENHLGGGCCRINLEAECAKGEFEAWEPNSHDSEINSLDRTMMITLTQEKADYILVHKDELENYLADELVRRMFALHGQEATEGGLST